MNSLQKGLSAVLCVCCLVHARAASAGSTGAAIRGDGTLIVDGEPVFPIGVRSEKLDEIEAVAACGFNMSGLLETGTG